MLSSNEIISTDQKKKDRGKLQLIRTSERESKSYRDLSFFFRIVADDAVSSLLERIKVLEDELSSLRTRMDDADDRDGNAAGADEIIAPLPTT